MLRWLYLLLLRLHPFGFRQRFAEEMLAIFDEVSGPRAVTSLFADVFVSLFRQWVFRPEFRQPMTAAPVSNVSPIFRSLDTYRPRPVALLNGGFISLAALWVAVVAMDHGGNRRPAFLIGVHHSSPHLLPVDRSSLAGNELNTAVKLGPEPVDPWHAIASVYFKLIRVLGALDADQDLVISRWEIVTAPDVLRKLDTDHDGKLSPEECGFSMGGNFEIADSQFVSRARLEFMRANPVLAALDADHDGEISETEISNSAAALRTLDKNGDGSLTPDEIIPDALPARAAMIFSRLDTNRDGKISSAELASEEAEPLRDILESADRNHDGATTVEELKKELRFREERRKQFENALRGAGLHQGALK